MPTWKRKIKKDLVPEAWPHSLGQDDFEKVRFVSQIFKYQKKALKQASKATNKKETELVRDALDHLLFKKRREDDVKAREKRNKSL